MEAKEAVKIAVKYVSELFERERISNLGLEEVDFDSETGSWNVTVGFSRPWDHKTGFLLGTEPESPTRTYKVVELDGASGVVRSITIWEH